MTDMVEKTPEQVDAMEQAMKADGVATEVDVQVDYFGVDERDRYTFPDGKSWVELKVLTEGERAKYLKKVNRKVTMKRATGDSEFQMSPGEERRALMEVAIVNWNLVRRDRTGEIMPVPFTSTALGDFLENANPSIIDKIEEKVREMNPWLAGEMSVEDIDEEIKRLNEMREQVIKREEGKGNSSGR